MINIKKIDLNLLVVLDALLDECNVTRAAERLGYTQPTISGMLIRLRDLFGDPLFVRTQRGLLPTPRALALAAPLKQLLADSQRLVARDVFDPASAEVTFTISSNDYMQHALLVPFIKVLRNEGSRSSWPLRHRLSSVLSDALARGQIDLAVTIPEFAMSDLPHGCFTASTMSSPFALSIRSRAAPPSTLSNSVITITSPFWTPRRFGSASSSLVLIGIPSSLFAKFIMALKLPGDPLLIACLRSLDLSSSLLRLRASCHIASTVSLASLLIWKLLSTLHRSSCQISQLSFSTT